MSALRKKILAAKRPTRTVHVEEWGVDVGVKELSLAERQSILQHVADAQTAADAYKADQALAEEERKGLPEAKALDHTQAMLMAGIIDPASGAVIFPRDAYEEFTELGYVTMSRLLTVFFEMNVLRDEQKSEDLKKTSD